MFKVNIPDRESLYFKNYNDIHQSILITYSACQSVDVKVTPQPHGGPTFTITGTWHRLSNNEPVPFKDVITTERVHVYDSPTHL